MPVCECVPCIKVFICGMCAWVWLGMYRHGTMYVHIVCAVCLMYGPVCVCVQNPHPLSLLAPAWASSVIDSLAESRSLGYSPLFPFRLLRAPNIPLVPTATVETLPLVGFLPWGWRGPCSPRKAGRQEGRGSDFDGLHCKGVPALADQRGCISGAHASIQGLF